MDTYGNTVAVINYSSTELLRAMILEMPLGRAIPVCNAVPPLQTEHTKQRNLTGPKSKPGKYVLSLY